MWPLAQCHENLVKPTVSFRSRRRREDVRHRIVDSHEIVRVRWRFHAITQTTTQTHTVTIGPTRKRGGGPPYDKEETSIGDEELAPEPETPSFSISDFCNLKETLSALQRGPSERVCMTADCGGQCAAVQRKTEVAPQQHQK